MRKCDPYWHDNSLMYEAKAFQLTTSSVPHAASTCRLLLDKYWHGRNRLKENDIDPQEAPEIGQCRLCQEPDSQPHMLHSCTDATTASLREDVVVTLRKAIFTYDKDKSAALSYDKLDTFSYNCCKKQINRNVYG